MECPKYHSHKTHKYGHQRGKQRYKCNECGRQFIEVKTERGYDEKTKLLCLKMYLSDAARSWGGRGATRGEFNYGSNAPLRSWGFPPLAIAVVSPGDETLDRGAFMVGRLCRCMVKT
ncbi:MAG: IS1 family transposase [Moorea sp. SIO3E2]|uniref:IS1/IS1595 family N-terminal zinc-binding domain-containing protein n=1 Tax=Moorena producens TaxID=1155739 RepID=UPI0005CAFB50|nr:IS1 family transposase [Moorena sp. SIO3A5]NEQ17015.1 IS1 family transposase [Moorena sp. SIO3E2]NES42589.1 IS1 family transposase [Moorena sp. SIO2C4]OLT66836.1 hypothetical protein BI334_19140 [Moorena producens 3L]